MTAKRPPAQTPITDGVEVLIPAGEPITDNTYLGDMPAPAGLRVTVYSAFHARNEEDALSTRYTRIPGIIVWKDDAGFFRDAGVTPAMIEQNPQLDFTGLV